jgi:uncharacterized membrane protein YcfT
MEALAHAVEGLALVEWLRFSRWGYAGTSAAHVLGIALLVGAVVPLDLRLLGAWSQVPLGALYRVLSRVAAAGLVLAIASGLLLFSVRASEYAVMDLFRVKLALVLLGALHALALHRRRRLEHAPRRRQRLAGAVSLATWPVVLVCGRLLAFV